VSLGVLGAFCLVWGASEAIAAGFRLF